MPKIFNPLFPAIALLLIAIPVSEGKNTNQSEGLIERAKTAASYDLADPNAAQFRNVFVSKKIPTYVCGEINAKNKFGAYIGFSQFSYNDNDGKVKILDSTNTQYKTHLILHSIYCGPSSQ